ncbi:HET-domain-containing protein, partial [Cadophora sp. DSE1049]
MSSWLKACVQSHGRCKQTHVVLPKRVLDLKNENPVLVLGNDREEPYGALSHCWGLKPPLRTTTSSFTSRMTRITLSTLPQTFQDAILVTRNLKLRYLWIDSLCIVQDDTEDWLTESAKMMDYYANAHVTISALRSGDSREGFLGDRITGQQILVSAEKKLYIRSKREQLRSMFFGEPLNSRAWTLQERLISTRIIHFGRHEMIWECNSCSARESGVTDLAPSNLADASAKNIDKMEVWEHLVKDYLTRSITRTTDRLPAISALARMLFEGSSFTYLAGILKEWPEGLLWDMDDGADQNTSAHDGAPSWSWAAAAGPI